MTNVHFVCVSVCFVFFAKILLIKFYWIFICFLSVSIVLKQKKIRLKRIRIKNWKTTKKKRNHTNQIIKKHHFTIKYIFLGIIRVLFSNYTLHGRDYIYIIYFGIIQFLRRKNVIKINIIIINVIKYRKWKKDSIRCAIKNSFFLDLVLCLLCVKLTKSREKKTFLQKEKNTLIGILKINKYHIRTKNKQKCLIKTIHHTYFHLLFSLHQHKETNCLKLLYKR